MKLIIKLSDLDKRPCDKYYNYIQYHFPDDQKFDAIELANKISVCKSEDVSWLIINCKLAQKEEMLKYYKSLKPDYEDIRFLIVNCKFAQTIEMLEYYKSLKPEYWNVSILIIRCKFAQTKEMLEYFKSLNPDYENVRRVINFCKFAKDNLDSINI